MCYFILWNNTYNWCWGIIDCNNLEYFCGGTLWAKALLNVNSMKWCDFLPFTLLTSIFSICSRWEANIAVALFKMWLSLSDLKKLIAVALCWLTMWRKFWGTQIIFWDDAAEAAAAVVEDNCKTSRRFATWALLVNVLPVAIAAFCTLVLFDE